MSEIAGIITAIVAALTTLGAAGKFIWDKIEARFQAIDAELDHCRTRETKSIERRMVQLSVIEILWQEVVRHAPSSPALGRAKHLLDDLKQKDRDDATGGTP